LRKGDNALFSNSRLPLGFIYLINRIETLRFPYGPFSIAYLLISWLSICLRIKATRLAVSGHWTTIDKRFWRLDPLTYQAVLLLAAMLIGPLQKTPAAFAVHHS